ncbi:MAG: AI-2E family transporter [Pseudomonadota bacterium]
MTFTNAQRRSLTWLAIGLAGGFILWLLAPVLTPFLVGAVMAYALQPAVERLVRRRVPRLLAVLVVEVVMLFSLVALVFLLVPIFSKELPLLRQQIPLFLDLINTTLLPWLAKFGINVNVDTASLKTMATSYLNANFEDWTAAVLNSARIGGSILMTVTGMVVLVPLVLFYLLMDWPQLVQRITQLIPPRMRPQTREVLVEVDTVLGQYLRGQLLVMLTLAAFYSIGLALFGFDLALPVGVFTGLAVFIPYLGFGIGMVLALIAGLLQFMSWYAIVAVAVVYGLGQLIESFFLTPRLVGERIGMHPLMVIFALLAFGHLFGFVGVLVALPLSAVLVVAVGRVKAAYLDSKLYSS